MRRLHMASWVWVSEAEDDEDEEEEEADVPLLIWPNMSCTSCMDLLAEHESETKARKWPRTLTFLRSSCSTSVFSTNSWPLLDAVESNR